MRRTSSAKERSSRPSKKGAKSKQPTKRAKIQSAPERDDKRDLPRPLKKQLTLRLDADVIAWFKASALRGEGYQTEMNRVLREHVLHRGRGRKKK
jgi:uncharacterized protein (DUF4415 family)